MDGPVGEENVRRNDLGVPRGILFGVAFQARKHIVGNNICTCLYGTEYAWSRAKGLGLILYSARQLAEPSTVVPRASENSCLLCLGPKYTTGALQYTTIHYLVGVWRRRPGQLRLVSFPPRWYSEFAHWFRHVRSEEAYLVDGSEYREV